MYQITVHSNPMLFISALAAGVAAVTYLPHVYPGQMLEIPLLALYAGEAGLALLCTLLFYENASPLQVVKLSFWVLGFSMAVGAIGNFAGQTTQFMPEQQVLISWVQLLIMNIAGVLSTLTLFQLLPPDKILMAQVKKSREQAAKAKAATAAAANQGEGQPAEPSTMSVKDILEQLDVSRINRLEKSLHPEEVSLESLFQQESQAARLAGGVPPEIKAITSSAANDSAVKAGSNLGDEQKVDQVLDQFASGKETVSLGQQLEFRDLLQGLQRDLSGGEQDVPAASSPEESKQVMSKFQQLLQGNLPDAEVVDQASARDMTEALVVEPDQVADDIEDAFSKILPESAQRECNRQELEKLKESRCRADADANDEVLELGEVEEAEEAEEVAGIAEVAEEPPSSPVASPPPKDVKEFGRLSGSFPVADENEAVGTMKTIGKMLLDAQAVENIIKAGDKPRSRLTTARVLSAADGENLDKLLSRINSFPGIEGSIIIGQDGLIIAGKLNTAADKEVLGNMSLAIQSNTSLVADKLELGGLRQIILQSQDKYVVLTTLEHGVLAVFTSGRPALNALLKSIQAAAVVQDAPAPEIALAPVSLPPPAGKEPPAAESEVLALAGDANPVLVNAESGEIEKEVSTAKPVAADEVKNLIESLVQSQGCPVIAESPTEQDNRDSEQMPVAASPAGEVEPAQTEVIGETSVKSKEVKEFGRLAISGS